MRVLVFKVLVCGGASFAGVPNKKGTLCLLTLVYIISFIAYVRLVAFCLLLFRLVYFLFTLCFIKEQMVNIVEGPKLINIIFMSVYVPSL